MLPQHIRVRPTYGSIPLIVFVSPVLIAASSVVSKIYFRLVHSTSKQKNNIIRNILIRAKRVSYTDLTKKKGKRQKAIYRLILRQKSLHQKIIFRFKTLPRR